MSNPVPSSLALTVIADGSPRIAAPVRNNFSDLQTAANAIVAILSGGAAGQLLRAVDADTVEWDSAIAGYRKTTAKAVNGTTSDTDLLNGEITVAANELGTNKLLRLTAWGDLLNNTGAGTDIPVFSLKLGGTTLLKTAVATPGSGAAVGASATRYGWRLACEIVNLGAANAQWASIDGKLSFLSGSTGNGAAQFTVGEGAVVLANAASTTKPAFALLEGGTQTAVDTTAACALALSVINPSSSISFETKLAGAVVEIL